MARNLRTMSDSDITIRIQQLSEARRQAEAHLSAILLSKSCRWTRPLRWIKTKFYELLLRKTIEREVGLVQSCTHDPLQRQPWQLHRHPEAARIRRQYPRPNGLNAEPDDLLTPPTYRKRRVREDGPAGDPDGIQA